MPGGKRDQEQRPRNNSPASNTRSRSRTSNPADVDENTRSRSGAGNPPIIADEPEGSASEIESGEDSVRDEEEANESSGTEETARNDEAGRNQREEGVDGENVGQNENDTLDPAEEIHRDLEGMLDTRIIAAENEGRIINKRMRCVKEDLSTYNLTRLKTAIDRLQTARKRVEETAREAARHNERKNSRDGAYAGRCHKKKTQ